MGSHQHSFSSLLPWEGHSPDQDGSFCLLYKMKRQLECSCSPSERVPSIMSQKHIFVTCKSQRFLYFANTSLLTKVLPSKCTWLQVISKCFATACFGHFTIGNRASDVFKSKQGRESILENAELIGRNDQFQIQFFWRHF